MGRCMCNGRVLGCGFLSLLLRGPRSILVTDICKYTAWAVVGGGWLSVVAFWGRRNVNEMLIESIVAGLLRNGSND